MIEIEKNIPLPKNRAKYNPMPFVGMDLNDSFFVAFEDHDPIRLRAFVATRASQHGARQLPRWKFTTKAEPDGVRVWRIK